MFSDCFLAAATLPGHKRSLTRFWQANQVLCRRLHRYRLQRGGQRVSARTSRPCRANFLPNSRTAFAPGLLLQRPHCNSESQHEVLQVLLPPKLSKSSRLPHIFFSGGCPKLAVAAGTHHSAKLAALARTSVPGTVPSRVSITRFELKVVCRLGTVFTDT